ncbi:universal stress protein [Halobellus limi]|jgi:nucleotide-binding universal stress UspA family protein|uniref:Universal stress protein n=1 Tax=Halobellus limi TaxID=699433 RepID=A0A1H6CU29_9EURY|nr:universal stress protein [Halobellus limi]QCC49128.1 universal stress protein [Halobellus limi]SEG76520.1 Nucleotide-binding universal stress protein, UspA family [Halobellus limi]
MYDQILIPYDGSDEAIKGAKHGIELAAALGAEVHALYVIDLPGAPRALALRDDEDRMREEYEEYGNEVLGNLADVADEHGVECTTAMRTGTPNEEIVGYAEDEGMDAIVMGSAYRGTIGGILGGTMDKVVRTATVPVITQRMQMDEL